MKEKNVWFRWIAWVLLFAMCMNSTGIATLAADGTEAEASKMQEAPPPNEEDKPPQEDAATEGISQKAPQERITESSQGFDIEFYVCLNGEKFLVQRNGIPNIVTWKEKKTTYHGIAVDDLVEIYKEFGFAKDEAGQNPDSVKKFVSAYRGEKGIEYGRVYTDPATGKTYVSYNDGEGKQGEAVDVYYLPKGKGLALKLNSTVRSDNSFYQVTVENESKETIYYALNGTTKEIVLSNVDEKNPKMPIPWTCFGVKDGSKTPPMEGTVNGEKTTFTITKMSQSYRIRRADYDKETSNFDIRFHVYVDNEIRILPSDSLQKVYKWSDKGEAYVAISDLAEIYKEYGLNPDETQFGAYFPYTMRGEKELSHAAMKTIGGKQYVSYTLPEQSVTVPTDVYYMPKKADKKEKVPVDIVDSNGTITSSVADQLKNNKNSFYSVTVIGEDGTRTVTYHKQGDDVKISVQKGNTDTKDWLASNEAGDKTIPPVEKDANTLEFTFQKMDQPYTIACKLYSPTTLHVKLYTFVDYQRNLITGIDEEIPVIKDTTSKPGTTYYYISNDELKSRLQKFHYNGSLRDASGKRERFYYGKRDLDTLHNAGVYTVNGAECIYVGKTGEPMDLYYLPGGETLPILNANTLMNYTDDRYNGFYSVTVLDEKGQVYDPSQLESLPKIDYVARKATGEDALTRTVSMKPRVESQTEDVIWECRLKEDGTSSAITPVVDTDKREMSFTIQGDDAVRPYVIVPANTEKPKEEIEANVSYHVFIDGDHRLVKNINTTLYYISEEHSGMKSRYYLRARADDTISQVYKEYGFKPEDLESETGGKGKLLFGHGTDTRVFVQYPYKDKDGTWYIPVLKNGHDVSVYYLATPCTLNPNKIENYFDRNTGLSAQIGSAGVKFNHLSSVHLMEVIDPLNLTEGKAVVRKYVPHGASFEVEVPKKATLKGEYEGKNIVWSLNASDKDAQLVIPTEGKNQDTWVYKWNKIESSYTLAADRPQPPGTVRVIYDTTRYMKKLPKEAKLTPQVGNKTRFTEDIPLEQINDYVIKDPYPLTYDHEDNDSKELEQYEFDHWDYRDSDGRWRECDSKVPLQTIYEQYPKLKEEPVVFYAAWKKVSDRNRKQVQFYICKSAMPEDAEVELPSVNENDFTGAVAVANCNVKANRIKDGQVLGDEGATKWEDYQKGHQEILKLLQGTTGHKGGAGFPDETIFKLDRIPSDEEVFQTIRESGRKIRIGQREIPSEKLDTEFFTVYWYSFKNETADGWHLDGRIVAKNGHVVVTKDFVGQPDVIQKIQENYYISIDMNEKTQSGATQPPAFHQHMDLVLPKAEGQKNPEPGRIQVVGEWTNKEHTSCQWIVKADSFWEYTLKEQNYQSTDPKVQCSSWYNVHHSHNEAENVNTWENYPETGIFFTGRGVGRGGESLTIELENRYQQNNVLTINKFDATTGHGMEKIEFAVTVDGAKKDPIITDQNGIAEIPIQLQEKDGSNRTATETYLLRETNVPTGYIDTGDVQLTVGIKDGKFKITEAKLVDREGVTAPQDGKVDGLSVLTVRGDTSLNVRNFSRTSALTIQKTWENRMDALTEQQVKIRLLRNGKATGKNFILNEDNNWQYTIDKVPLFIDQNPVQYTIQEIEIGKTHYSPEFGDGFLYYEVIYPEIVYKDDQGTKLTPTSPEEFAKIRKMDLEVQNMHFNLAERSFLKTDDLPRKRLQGAKFQLYQVPYKEGTTDYVDDKAYTVVEENGSIVLKENGNTCTADPKLSFTTDEKGMISLPQVEKGRYWMVETSTPNKGNQNLTQYEDNLSLYMVEVQDEILFLYEREDQKTTFKGLSDRHVVNHPQTGGITVEIRKEIAGPFGQKDQPFDVEVYYQEEGMQMYKTVKASLKHGDVLKVEHVNIGSTMKITETIGDAKYSVSLLREKGSEKPELIQTATVENGKAVMTCKVEGMPKTTQKWILQNANTEDATPDTGIHLEKNLYLWILAIAAATSVLLFFRRRRNRMNRE